MARRADRPDAHGDGDEFRDALIATRTTWKENPMKREALTEKILDIKREKNWTWAHITGEIGGMSPVLVVGALLGQM